MAELFDRQQFLLPNTFSNSLYHTMSSVPRTSYLPIHPQLHPLPPIAIAPNPHGPQQHPHQHQPTQMSRKRPKYSRSKTGCLSCRVRKVKCDEARPICTRCSHSQRDCTWPQEALKAKRSQTSGSEQEGPSAVPSRPSTSSSQIATQTEALDNEWDSGIGAGAIRRANSAHGRISSHARIPSISGHHRGRNISMSSNVSLSRSSSQNHSSSRDHSPGPFAYNISHLSTASGHSGVGHHHRSASTSSTSSMISNSGLPYPLIAHQHPPLPTALPRLLPSTSPSSIHSSNFSQSPTLAWPSSDLTNPDYHPRPGTSGGGIAAPFGSMDLNGYPGSDYGHSEMLGNDGVTATYLGSGGFGGGADGPYSGLPSFDGMTYGVQSGYDGSEHIGGYDHPTSDFPSSHLGPGLEPQSFLDNLQMSLPEDSERQLAYHPGLSSGNSSSESSDMEMELPSDGVGSVDPRALSSSAPSGMGFGQQTGMGFGGREVSRAGFGETKRSTSQHREPETAMGFGGTIDLSEAGFGTDHGYPTTYCLDQGLQQPQEHVQHHTNSVAAYHPMVQEQQQSEHPSVGFGQDVNQGSPLGFGNRPAHYFPEEGMMTTNQSPQLCTSEARATMGPQPPLKGEDEAAQSQAETVADRYMDTTGASAGALGPMRASPRMTEMLPRDQSMYHSRSRSIPVVRWEGLAQGPSPSTTPTPAFEHPPIHPSMPSSQDQHSHHFDPTSAHPTTSTQSFNLHPLHPQHPHQLPEQTATQMGNQTQVPNLSEEQRQQIMAHARTRSDTITPAIYRTTASRQNSRDSEIRGRDDGCAVVARGEASTQWGDGLVGLAGAVGGAGVGGSTAETAGLSPKNGQSSAVSSPSSRRVMMNPDPIEPFFKSVQERNLIRHYCQTATMLTMALPSSLNPILSIHMPIILSSAASSPTSPTGSSSPGSSPGQNNHSPLSSHQGQTPLPCRVACLSPTQAAIEALRLSVLGVASIHQSYLLAKSGPENKVRATEMWSLAGNVRVAASRCLAVAVGSIEGCRSDAALGACVSIALIDIFAGGHNYASNMALAKTLVRLRGGPAAVVRASRASLQNGCQSQPHSASLEGPMHFVEGTSPSDDDCAKPSLRRCSPPSPKTKKGNFISSARLLLEILAVYEVFATMTSGEEPTLLAPGSCAWWFESGSNYHLFSVEKVFGMSRSIVEVFARVSAFLNRHRQQRAPSKKVSDDHSTRDDSSSKSPKIYLSALTETPPSPSSPHATLHAEAFALLHEVQNWKDHRPPTAIHPRVHHGNEAHRSSLLILLLREAFNVPASDPRVQHCVENTLAACWDGSANFSMSVDLTWPVIIAGCQATGALRAATIRALQGFRKQCCFEIDTSERIVAEVWRRMDCRHPAADFRSVIEDLDLRVLIL